MQIRSDYTGFSGRSYQDNPLYKNGRETEKEKESGSQVGQEKKDASGYRKRESVYSRDGDSCQITRMEEEKEPSKKEKETSLLKELWDSLGDEGADTAGNSQGIHLMAGFQNIKTAIKTFIREHILEPAKEFPQKIQKISGRRKEMSGTLADGKMAGEGGMPGQSGNDADKKEREWKPWEDESLGKMLHHSHLTDSYTRTGEYCSLSENVTYDSRRRRGQEK